MKKVNDMLTEELGTEITNLSNLEPGSEEHTAAVNSLDKLYNMKLDSIKVENEIQKFEKLVAAAASGTASAAAAVSMAQEIIRPQ